MRLFPLLTAVLVMVTLYGLLFERDRVLAFAGVAGQDTGALSLEAGPTAAAEIPDAGANTHAVAVVALRSQARMIENVVTIRGRTEAARQVVVMAETSGRVISDPLRRGAQVETGQTLCALDPGTRPAALAEAEARLAEAEIGARAASSLSQEGFASETRVAGAQAALKSAQAGVEAAQTEIARLTITAPFAGLLETDAAELGMLLQPGALCAEVIALDPIKLVAFVPETEVEAVTLDAPATAHLASGRQVSGRVSFISRSADETTRTFRVEIAVANPDLAIRDGQTVEVAVASAGQTAHLLPASALTLNDAGTLGVRIARDGVAHFVPVTLLRDTVDGVWLTGLAKVADVIVVGQEFVIDGVPVTVTLTDAAE